MLRQRGQRSMLYKKGLKSSSDPKFCSCVCLLSIDYNCAFGVYVSSSKYFLLSKICICSCTTYVIYLNILP